MMIILVLIIGFGIYYIYKNNTVLDNDNKENNAEDILRQRYVNGEIDDETFARMIKVIKK
ncbi:MAG: SHOCT domain-containing protein [Sedimentibacter sp.]